MATSTIKSNADYVVEQGTSGMWTYRKWNSGIAECWCLTPQTSKTVSTSYGVGYYGAKDTYSFPSGLFASAEISITASLRDSGAIGTWFSVQTITAAYMDGYVFSITSNTISIRLGIHAIGRWK